MGVVCVYVRTVSHAVVGGVDKVVDLESSSKTSSDYLSYDVSQYESSPMCLSQDTTPFRYLR